jgi:hypothetical protein
VNGPEILHLIRNELQHAVARQGEPPTPRPMDASPWVAMSAMQKAIRRGREDLALCAAATLLRDAPDKLWRRIGCVAYEDVGVACRDAVGLATVALGESKFARRWGANGRSPAVLFPNFAGFRNVVRPTISSWHVSFTLPTPRPAPSCRS